MENQCYAVMKRLLEEHEKKHRLTGVGFDVSKQSRRRWTEFEIGWIKDKVNTLINDISMKTGFPVVEIKNRIKYLL